MEGTNLTELDTKGAISWRHSEIHGTIQLWPNDCRGGWRFQKKTVRGEGMDSEGGEIFCVASSYHRLRPQVKQQRTHNIKGR